MVKKFFFTFFLVGSLSNENTLSPAAAALSSPAVKPTLGRDGGPLQRPATAKCLGAPPFIPERAVPRGSPERNPFRTPIFFSEEARISEVPDAIKRRLEPPLRGIHYTLPSKRDVSMSTDADYLASCKRESRTHKIPYLWERTIRPLGTFWCDDIAVTPYVAQIRYGFYGGVRKEDGATGDEVPLQTIGVAYKIDSWFRVVGLGSDGPVPVFPEGTVRTMILFDENDLSECLYKLSDDDDDKEPMREGRMDRYIYSFMGIHAVRAFKRAKQEVNKTWFAPWCKRDKPEAFLPYEEPADSVSTRTEARPSVGRAAAREVASAALVAGGPVGWLVTKALLAFWKP